MRTREASLFRRALGKVLQKKAPIVNEPGRPNTFRRRDNVKELPAMKSRCPKLFELSGIDTAVKIH
jgi:hypothetical protein